MRSCRKNVSLAGSLLLTVVQCDAEQPASSTSHRSESTSGASTSYKHLLERHSGEHRVWGAIVSFGHLTASPSDATGDGGTVRLRPASEYFVDVLMNTAEGGVPAFGNIMGCASLHQTLLDAS